MQKDIDSNPLRLSSLFKPPLPPVHYLNLPLNREGRWDTKNDFSPSFLHLSVLHCNLPPPIPKVNKTLKQLTPLPVLMQKWPYPPKSVTLILFMIFLFLQTGKEHPFSFQMMPRLCKCANRLKSYWWINLATVQSSILRNWAEKMLFRIQQYYNSHNLKCLNLS